MSPLVPHLLEGKSAAEIAGIELQTTRQKMTAGDAFRIRMGDTQNIRIEGGDDRLDRVGYEMVSGEIAVAGDVGSEAGRLMAGGRLTIDGDAGPWAASRMTDGLIEIAGDAGDRIAGPLAGETVGMAGGIVIVRGNAGERAGDRLRRGVILVEGSAGRYAGSRIIAGTLIIRGHAGELPGYLLQRGTIVLGAGCEKHSPTFVDCGVHEPLAFRLLAAFLDPLSPSLARLIRRPLRRLAGDMAVSGKGEILQPAART